jgi:chitin synthase
VFLSQAAFHGLENHLRSSDTEEQKRNRMRDAEAAAGAERRETNDPYSPYSPYPMLGAQPSEESPFGVQFGEND